MKKTLRPLLNVKTGFQLTILSYWGAVLFVSPTFLYLLLPYFLFRTFAYIENFTAYDEWKIRAFAQNDQTLTVRKLAYLINEAQKYDLKNAKETRHDYFYDKTAFIFLDEHIRLELEKEKENNRYEALLYFNERLVTKTKAFSFQTIHWKLKEFPELERALTKSLHSLEQEINVRQMKAKKEKTKEKKRMLEQKSRNKKALAKEIKEAYKKDMSI